MIATFSLFTTLATFALVLIGGIVNPTGSSLACPDWPTCYGTFFPEMVGGIRFEHTHRIVAATVGLMTCVLAFWVWRHPIHNRLRWWALMAVGLVIFQGLLGGITVLMKLPVFVSTAHFATSLLFLMTLIYLTFRLYTPTETSCASNTCQVCDPLHPSQCVKHSLIALYIQMILGAWVRHTGSGPACGQDVLTCAGTWLPHWGAGQLHMAHRLLAIFIAGVVTFSAWRVLRMKPRATFTQMLAGSLVILVLSQITLGIFTVQSAIALLPVTLHLGVGTLLLITLFLLHLRLKSSSYTI